jgi:hypothetical protein
MKKIKQYLPFILWSIATILLTVIAFVLLPFLILWKKLERYFDKNTEVISHDEGVADTNSIYVF